MALDSDRLSAHMRAAAILGLGCSAKSLQPFQAEKAIEWRMGVPAAASDADGILLLGGDGTVHRHLGQLLRLGLPVLVVPSGSGNDFARALGLRRVTDSLAAWEKFCSGAANVSVIDLGVISPARGEARPPHQRRYFCCVASVGLDSEVARRANQLPRWLRSRGGYVMSLLPTIFGFRAVKTRILASPRSSPADPADGTGAQPFGPWQLCSEQLTTLAAFANTSTYGDGMKIAPRAKMDDGLLDICVVAGLDRFKLFCMFPTVYGGGHLKMSEVAYFQAARVRVETERPLEVYADGEYVCPTPVEITIEPAAIKVIVP